jgi:hypothetical protein
VYREREGSAYLGTRSNQKKSRHAVKEAAELAVKEAAELVSLSKSI